ncbi:hypothetical protein TNCT_174761 [Trichonephila clavata]|uniref:Uncharacterized protein n=1 Tax=Trichonephila clavata TaxID=2740835 RepID=A0A8X6F1K7_TRICU|nr:hypothetical protein TNCT_174761 [Trichonephila clavata]
MLMFHAVGATCWGRGQAVGLLCERETRNLGHFVSLCIPPLNQWTSKGFSHFNFENRKSNRISTFCFRFSIEWAEDMTHADVRHRTDGIWVCFQQGGHVPSFS